MHKRTDSTTDQTVTSAALAFVSHSASIKPRIHRQSQIYQAITRMSNEQELFPLVCQIAVDFGGASMAWVGVADPATEQITPVASVGTGTDYLRNIYISTRQDQPEGRGPSATAYRNMQAVIINDWASSPLTAPWHQQASPFHWGSSGSFPIQHKGQPIGVLSVYHEAKNFFDSETSLLFHEISHDITSALDNFDREQERRHTLEALRANAQHFRAYFERSMLGMAASSADKSILEVNQALCDMLGYTTAELEGTSWETLSHPDDLESSTHFFQQLVEGAIDDFALEKRFIKKCGETIDVHLSVRAIRHTGGGFAYAVSVTEDITLRKMAERREHMRKNTLEKVAKGCSLEEIMSHIIETSEAIYPGIICSVLLLDNEGKHLCIGAAPSLPDFYNQAIDNFAIGAQAGSCGAAAYSGKRFFVENIATHPNWKDYRALAAQAGLGSCWSVPIHAASGHVLGTFAMYRKEPSTPSDHEIALIESAANLLGIAIDRVRAEEELQLASSIYLNISEGVLVTDANHKIVACNPAFSRISGYSFDEIQGKEPFLLHSDRNQPELSAVMLDSMTQRGYWQGEIWNRRKNGEVFLTWLTINAIRDDQGEVQSYISIGSDISSKVRSDELIWRQANYDFLTDLPNRHMFQDRLQQEIGKSLRENALLALLFLDLDHFKDVNDSLGHSMGDQLLVQAAERIKNCVRETDTVARMGGDEFTVILPKLKTTLDAEKVAKHIISALAEPYFIGNETIYVGASIGIAFCPNDTTSLDQLVRSADQAMYASKALGRNRLSYFTQSLHDEAFNRLKMLSDMRAAIASEQFELYFQPILDLNDKRICKAEALIRWHHPERGMISPAEFIPLAEESGLIVSIGDWVFKEAASKAKYWSDLLNFELQISINISPAQFQSTSLNISDWMTYLQQLGLATKQLNIEITEGLLLNASEDVKNKLLQLRDAGVQVAIDDFGVGYSALSYLRQLDIDHLKIDQSFIQNLDAVQNDLVLTEAIVVMAHKLGLKVTAEGVETEEQRRLLLDIGCDYGQGYLFSRPLPAAAFEAFLKNSQASA